VLLPTEFDRPCRLMVFLATIDHIPAPVRSLLNRCSTRGVGEPSTLGPSQERKTNAGEGDTDSAEGDWFARQCSGEKNASTDREKVTPPVGMGRLPCCLLATNGQYPHGPFTPRGQRCPRFVLLPVGLRAGAHRLSGRASSEDGPGCVGRNNT
jgi:hypothetical protein